MVESIYSAQGMQFLGSPTPQNMIHPLRPMINNQNAYGPSPSPYYQYPAGMVAPSRTRPEIMVNNSFIDNSTDDVFADTEVSYVFVFTSLFSCRMQNFNLQQIICTDWF